MRIAYVTETYPPEINGVSLTAERALRHLRSAGHAVQLVRPRQRGEAPRDDAAEWRTAGAPIPLYPSLRFGLAWPAGLRRRWQRDVPDLVHVATPGPLAWAALHAARVQGIATSADFRTNFHRYSRHYKVGWLEPVLLAYLRGLHAMADCSFVPTHELADTLSAHGFARPLVIGRGVDAQLFSPARRDRHLRARWGAGEDDRVLLHVGRLAPEKNVELALACYERLREAQPDLRLVVVGEGPLRATLAAAHRDVHFAGAQFGIDLARHYASADVFLFPSLTDTFGNVVPEALASGLALVAFDTAAARALVCNGRSGWLATPGDEAGFLSAARHALADAAPGSTLRQHARRVGQRTDWYTPLQLFEQHLHRTVLQAASRGAGPHVALV